MLLNFRFDPKSAKFTPIDPSSGFFGASTYLSFFLFGMKNGVNLNEVDPKTWIQFGSAIETGNET